jgi:hypothetical protein
MCVVCGYDYNSIELRELLCTNAEYRQYMIDHPTHQHANEAPFISRPSYSPLNIMNGNVRHSNGNGNARASPSKLTDAKSSSPSCQPSASKASGKVKAKREGGRRGKAKTTTTTTTNGNDHDDDDDDGDDNDGHNDHFDGTSLLLPSAPITKDDLTKRMIHI